MLNKPAFWEVYINVLHIQIQFTLFFISNLNDDSGKFHDNKRMCQQPACLAWHVKPRMSIVVVFFPRMSGVCVCVCQQPACLLMRCLLVKPRMSVNVLFTWQTTHVWHGSVTTHVCCTVKFENLKDAINFRMSITYLVTAVGPRSFHFYYPFKTGVSRLPHRSL